MGQPFEGRTIAVLADCHIHPGAGIHWPSGLLDTLAGVDLIVTLGDMGEGFAALTEVAPVIGVRGVDDTDDPRAATTLLVLEQGPVRIGCVFDPQASGIATSKAPLVLDEGLERRFGEPITALLWASTHIPSIELVDGRPCVNPGSATLPETGCTASWARLTVDGGKVEAEIVALA